MFIEKLKLDDFMLHGNTEIDFRCPVAMLLGASEQGKSTIPGAARWALDEVWLNPLNHRKVQKNFQSELIQRGKKKAVVTVDTNTGEYYRSRTPSISSSNPKAADSPPADPEVLSCLFNSTHYFTMDAKERGAMLFELLGLDVDPDAVIANALDALGKEKAQVLDQDEWTKIRMGYVANKFDGAKDKVVEMRRQFKRDMEDVPKEKPSAVLAVQYEKDGAWHKKTVDVEKQGVTEESLKGKIEALEVEKNDLLARRAKLEGKQEQSLDYIRNQIEVQKDTIASCENKLEAYGESDDELEKLDKKIEAVTKEMQETRDKIRRIEGQIEATPDLSGENCPTCGRKFTKAMKEKASGELTSLKANLESLRLNHDNQRTELEGLDDKRGKIAVRQSDRVRLIDDLRTAKKELDRLQEAEKNAADYTANKKEVEEITSLLKDVTGKLAGYYALKTAYGTYKDELEAYEAGSNKRSDLLAKVAVLNELDTLFGTGPDSMRAQLTMATMNKVNAILDEFKGLLGRGIRLNDELDVVFSDAQKQETAALSLNQRAGIAVQAVIALFSGLRFFVIDDVEHLTRGPRNALMKLAVSLAKEHGLQIWIVAAVNDEEIEKAAALAKHYPEIQVIQVQNGQVKDLGVKEAA